MHRDPPSSTGVEVDVVETHAEPPDRHEQVRGHHQLGVNLSAISHDQCPGIGDGGQKLAWPVGESGVAQDLVVGLHPVDEHLVHEF